LPLHNDIDSMWLTFKQELQHRTIQFIPMMRNTWKEERWTRPLNSKLPEHISKNHRLWTRYSETRDNGVPYLKNINQSVIELEMKFGNYKKRNNRMSRNIANKIQRQAYINSKRKTKTGIDELNTVDILVILLQSVLI